MSSKRTPLAFAEAVAALALISWVIAPGRQSARVIQSMNAGLSQSILAAMGGAVIQDMRTAAEKFHEEAMRAIGEFWKGFTDE